MKKIINYTYVSCKDIEEVLDILESYNDKIIQILPKTRNDFGYWVILRLSVPKEIENNIFNEYFDAFQK